jgi:hypothetical protein
MNLNSNKMKITDENSSNEDNDEIILTKAKYTLMKCATADSVVRSNDDALWNLYFNDQQHVSIKHLIKQHVATAANNSGQQLLQISTNSKMCMSRPNLDDLGEFIGIKNKAMMHSHLLQSFETQQTFANKVKQFLVEAQSNPNELKLMVVQCDFSKKYDPDLLSCVRYTIVEMLKETGI